MVTYDYVDEDGHLLYQACRFEPKDFRQRRPNGKGGWEYKVKGSRLVPYRLQELLKSDQVFITEGEKDADNLADHGLVATCNAMGAGKWRKDYNDFFRGMEVVILPDNDDPGRQHAQRRFAAKTWKYKRYVYQHFLDFAGNLPLSQVRKSTKRSGACGKRRLTRNGSFPTLKPANPTSSGAG